MSNKVTIQKIAEMAGVSRGTVDRVLNNRSYVQKDVRDRVLEIVRETGYVSQREAHLREREDRSKELCIGVLLPNPQFGVQFLEEVKQGIENAQTGLEDSNVKILVRQCESELPEEAVSLIDELMKKGARGVAVCALSDPLIAERLLALKNEGIPCVTFNSDIAGSGRLMFVGQDIRRTGRVAAELMSKCVRAGEQVIAAVGNLKFEGHQERLIGFRERMEELGFPEDDILTAETFNDYGTSVEVVSGMIEEHPKIRGIYMANLSVAGCAEAVRRAGKQGEIHIICHDINPGINQLLQKGLVDFTIPQDFASQGYMPLVCLADYLRGRPIEEYRQEAGEIRVLCRENL